MRKKKRKYKKRHDKITVAFDIAETLNLSDPYELTMVACCCALNDLTQVHKELIKRSSTNKDNDYKWFLLKIAIAQLREAYWFINQSFVKDKALGSRILEIPKTKELLDRIIVQVDGSDEQSFAFIVLRKLRHIIFHYGFKDRDIILQIADEMHTENIPGMIVLGNKKPDNYYQFADDLLLNVVLKYGEDYGLTFNELLDKMGNLTAQVIELLDVIVAAFILSKKNIAEQIEKGLSNN